MRNILSSCQNRWLRLRGGVSTLGIPVGTRLLVSVLLTSSAFAQVDTATITGVITDPSGLAIVGARIRATNQATGLEHSTSSNEGGLYVLTALPIGKYDMEITGQGFQTV